MKKNKNIILTFILMFIGVFSASALTKSDLDYIEEDFISLELNSLRFVGEYGNARKNFRENENPNVDLVDNYIFSNIAWDKTLGKYNLNYLLNPDYLETGEGIKIQIPADVFESEVAKHFNVTSDFYTELRENFDVDWEVESEYKKIDDEYYYYAEVTFGGGFGPGEWPLIKGYEDLGNNIYQMYYYIVNDDFNEEDLNNENAIFVENVDEETGEIYEIKYLLEGYFTSKIEYKGGNIKYLSCEEIDKSKVPADKDLVLYEDVVKNDETSKEEEKEFNVKDEVWKKFLIELVREESDIEYNDDSLIVYYSSYEGADVIQIEFEYSNGVLKLKEGPLGTEWFLHEIVKIAMKDYTYGEKNLLIDSMFNPHGEYALSNKFTLKNDGIEYKIVRKEYSGNRATADIESFAIDLKNGINMENLKKFHKGQNAYKYMDGEDQKFNTTSGKELTFRIDADIKLFEKLYIDGEEVDKKYYTVKEGSTIITFTEEYAKKLNSGDHTLRATFADGKQAIAEFTVSTEKETTKVENPKTGINLGYGMMLLLGIIGAVIYMFIRKRSNFPKHN